LLFTLRKYQVDPRWIAESAALGYVTEEAWHSFGEGRQEVLETLQAVLGLDVQANAGEAIKMLTAQRAAKQAAEQGVKRTQQADVKRQSVPLDAMASKNRLGAFAGANPGFYMDREGLPTQAYLGLTDTMAKRADFQAERLKQVVAKGDKLQQRRTRGRDAEEADEIRQEEDVSAAPKGHSEYRAKLATMALNWCSLGLVNLNIAALQDLHYETYMTFANFVLGKEVAGHPAGLDWEEVLEIEFSVRRSWWESVDQGSTLNRAILDSVGHNVAKQRSGLWQTVILQKMAERGSGRGKGGGSRKRERAGEEEGSRSTWQKSKGGKDSSWKGSDKGGKRSKGKGGKKGKGKGKGDKGGGKGKGANLPEKFRGKLSWCQAHSSRICYDHHLEEKCPAGEGCRFCHICCPEPNCDKKCSDGQHGLWSHN
jgi:hypothetical protein